MKISMPSVLSNALSSPHVVAAAHKAGFDLNNPANVSRLLAYAGVAGFQLETEVISEVNPSGNSLKRSTILAELSSPAVQVASQQAGLNLFDSAQFDAPRTPNAYVKNALSMYVQIAAI